MTAIWPSTIPQCPLLNGLSEQRKRNVVAFAPDVGDSIMRRRSTAAYVLTSLTFKMTTTELAAFNAFYETTLQDGSLPFDWAHPITKITWTWCFDGDEPPRIDRMTPKTHRVSFNLLRLHM